MKSSSTKAFTLIELLIAITIFMLFLGIVSGSYLTLVSANRNANETQKLYREVRLVFDTLAEKIRSGVLDYSCIDPALAATEGPCLEDINQPSKRTMRVLDSAGTTRTRLSFKNGQLRESRETRDSPNSAWIVESDALPLITTADISDLTFTIFPHKNPYAQGNAADDALQYQPTVTIIMKIKNYTFRTTYASRAYGTTNFYATK